LSAALLGAKAALSFGDVSTFVVAATRVNAAAAAKNAQLAVKRRYETTRFLFV
jgi:hypothetical protein